MLEWAPAVLVSPMDKYRPIDCRLHDHVEIACLRRYRVRIRTADDRIVAGTALDTETTAEKAEYLVVATAAGRERLRLDEIVQLEPLVAGAQFGVVRFR